MEGQSVALSLALWLAALPSAAAWLTPAPLAAPPPASAHALPLTPAPSSGADPAQPPSPLPDPEALLRRTADAEKRNRLESALFVYREDIRSSLAMAGQPPRQTSWITYEVTFLEGESYHRVVARDGQPLSAEQQTAEDQRMQQVAGFRRATPLEERRRRHFAAEERRYRFDSLLVLRHHTLRLLGAGSVRGRPVWLLSAQPRPGAPKPKRRSEWSLCQRLTYSIDQHTSLPLRIESEQLYDFEGSRKGARSSVETVEVEGVLLPSRITSTWQARQGARQITQTTDQSYSEYKRFRAETVLRFSEPTSDGRH